MGELSLKILWPVKGKKVLLREFLHQDISDSYVSWLNDAEVVKFSNQRFIVHDRLSCERYFKSFSGTDNFFLAIEDLASSDLLGTMSAYVSRNHGTVDVGIMIGKRDAWGRGIGQDAWDACLKGLFSIPWVRKVTAGTLDVNFGMLRLMQRSGMILEGIRREQELFNGVPHDIHLYGKLRSA